MRKSRQVKIDEKTIVIIKELCISEIMSLQDQLAKAFAEAKGEAVNMQQIIEIIKLIAPSCLSIKADDLLSLTPSEIFELWAAFKEVNKDFLAILDWMGVLNQVKSAFQVFFVKSTPNQMEQSEPGSERFPPMKP